MRAIGITKASVPIRGVDDVHWAGKTKGNLIERISSMMTFSIRHPSLPWAIAASAYVLAAGCAGNPPIMSDLLSGNQVCLALDWGSAPRPHFFGWTAPDTMLLLRMNRVPVRYHEADAEGMVGLAASQADRKGGGWIWWSRGDTLWVSSQSPTMDDLVIQAVRPNERTRASWKGLGFSGSERGQVNLQAYPCSALAQSSP
jgi:hypothetical protein